MIDNKQNKQRLMVIVIIVIALLALGLSGLAIILSGNDNLKLASQSTVIRWDNNEETTYLLQPIRLRITFPKSWSIDPYSTPTRVAFFDERARTLGAQDLELAHGIKIEISMQVVENRAAFDRYVNEQISKSRSEIYNQRTLTIANGPAIQFEWSEAGNGITTYVYHREKAITIVGYFSEAELREEQQRIYRSIVESVKLY